MFLKHLPKTITCRELEDFILAYLDGDLPYNQNFTIKLHLKGCRECRDHLAAYRTTIAITRRLYKGPDGLVPDNVPEDLIDASLAARVA